MEIARKLENVRRVLDSMTTQKNIAQFLNNAENAQKLNDLVDDVREAVMDYQVRIPKGLAFIVSNACPRLPYNGISTTTPSN